VQARPITSLSDVLEWKLPHPKAVLARGSFAEFVPEPISPLFATLAVPIAREATVNLMSGFGVTGENSYLFAVLNDYVYVGFIFTPKLIWPMIKASFQLMGPMLKSTPQRAVTAREKFVAMVQKWQVRESAALTPSELLVGVREIFTETALYYNMAQSGTIPAAMISEATFGAFYKALVKRKSDPKTEVFVFGTENHALRAEKALFDIAMWIKEQPELADYVTRTPAEEICEALRTLSPVVGEFSTRFGAYLREYGHAIYDLDFAKPTPSEAPAPLVETLKVYLAEKNNPYERQKAALELREQAEATIAKRLDPLRRKYFLKLLKGAQETAPLREDSIADMGLGHPQIRQMLGELGQRLAEGGAIPSADDIYWLEAQELDELAKRLENGEVLESFTAQIEKRKTKWQAMRHIIPPNTLPQKTWMSKFFANNEQGGNIIKGFGASAGQATARACVMLGPEDFSKMQSGDVIVAGITTPAWTTLFARASAIVTDIGGPLSHSSIVAREYGIPAVLATGVGTRRIQDGQTITVDGTAGLVTLHEATTGTTGSSEDGTLNWAPPDPKGIYMRASAADLMPKPLSPLFRTLGIPAQVEQMQPLGKRLLGPEPALAKDYFTSINSYAYLNAAISPRSWWWILTGMLPAYPRLLRSLVPLWRDELHPQYQAFVASKKDLKTADLSAGELWHEIRQLVSAAAYYIGGLMFATMGASAGSEGLLTRVYARLAKREGDPDATTLLMGWDNIPVRSEKSLYDIAIWIAKDEKLAEYILNTPSHDLARQLNAPDSVPVPLFSEFAARFQTHLDKFGHIVFQLDYAEPLPLDHPEVLLENVKMYLRGEGINPHERQQASEQKRRQTAETMLKRLKGFKRWAFQKSLNWGQSMAEVREDALAEIGLAYPKLRELLCELGRRCVEAGAIQKAEDIFWLEKDEISDCVVKLGNGQTPNNLMAQVERRKTFNERVGQIAPPPMIPMRKRIAGIKTDTFIAQTEESQTGNVLKGVPTSAGKVTAPARVLHSPEDFCQMRPGEVLVAGTTTPAWTPLFAMASAVVTDIGGPLSHGSIVAREYGIPAVMGTGVATKRIQNGQIITVDGGAGIVSLN
jgi:phosphohistidine swiveling domain-containing protein